MSKPLHRLPPAALTALACSALLAACGGGDDGATDPLQTYRSQTLQWQACSAELLGQEYVPAATLAHLGHSLQCAKVRAPMDWNDPSQGDVLVAVMRLSSSQPSQRKASLFFNPGGPGEDGLTTALSIGLLLDQGRADSALGAKLLQLRERYDLVGFSPRGLGASTALECSAQARQRTAAATAQSAPAIPEDLLERQIDELDQASAMMAEACQRTALSRHVNTDTTARDMDLLRGLLGDDKLHYFGYSYGTWLGAWYAGLFPEKVGRMVLDSVEDFTSTHEETTRSMAPARERLHREVLVPYFTRHASSYGLDVSTQPLGQQIDQLDGHLHRHLGGLITGKTYNASQLDPYGEGLAAALGLEQVLKRLPATATGDDLLAALQSHAFHTSDLARDARIRQAALGLASQLSDNEEGEDDDEDVGAQTLSTSATVLLSVNCNDTPSLIDAGAWRAAMRQDAAASPLFFSGGLHCVRWGGPSVSQPALARLQSVNALIVQSQYDGATPAEGAARTFAQMPAAKQVYVPGEYVHALFPYAKAEGDDPCVDHAVADYLLGNDAAPRSTTCGARPLDLDRATTKSASAEGPTYRDPATAQELIDAIHATTRPRR